MAELGTGTTITFDSGFFAEILSVSASGMSRASIDVTHMGTTVAKEFTPGVLIDNGSIDIEIAFDPGTPPAIIDAVANPVVFGSCVIAFGNEAVKNTITGDAFMTDFTYSAQLEEKMTASATLKWAGTVTWA